MQAFLLVLSCVLAAATATTVPEVTAVETISSSYQSVTAMIRSLFPDLTIEDFSSTVPASTIVALTVPASTIVALTDDLSAPASTIVASLTDDLSVPVSTMITMVESTVPATITESISVASSALVLASS